jgi:hypothetical protein
MRGFAHGLDETSHGQVDAGGAVEHVVAFEQRRPAAATGELVEAGLAGGEGVGLVLEAADGDAHGGPVMGSGAAARRSPAVRALF